MGNNKAFAAWALFLVSAAGLLITSLVASGVATLPPFTTFLTDIALGLGVRAAYKQVGGWDWTDWSWSFAGDAPQVMASVVQLHTTTTEESAKAA